jgi:hypothetical protein
VGGTSFNGNGGAEIVWNDSGSGNGAGGGGVSTRFCMPAYQDQKTRLQEGHELVVHEQIFYDGAWADGIGGTSASTPMRAAIAALTNDSPFCSDEDSGTPGVLPQVLYKVASTYHSYIYSPKSQGLRDITSGDNDYTPTGYGLGSVMVGGLSSNGKEWITYLPGYTALACHAEARKLTSVKVTRVQGPRYRHRELRQDGVHAHPAGRVRSHGRHQDLRGSPLVKPRDQGGPLHLLTRLEQGPAR